VIGRDTKGITVANAFHYVMGWTITNVDRNTIDEKIFQGKGGIGYTPLGPWVETELNHPDDVTINGEIRAASGTTCRLPSRKASSTSPTVSRSASGDVVITGAPNTAVPVKPTRHRGDHDRRHRVSHQRKWCEVAAAPTRDISSASVAIVVHADHDVSVYIHTAVNSA